MKKSLLCFLLLFVNFVPAVWGDVSDRMKARLSDVVAAKDAGTVGEGVDGLLTYAPLPIAQPRNWLRQRMPTANNSLKT